MIQIDFQVLFGGLYRFGSSWVAWFIEHRSQILFWYEIGVYIFLIIGTGFAFYFVSKIIAIRTKEKIDLYGGPVNIVPEATKPTNPHWQAINIKLQSQNSNDWKQAIMEADKILEEMVKKMGYAGDNLGERLKAVEPSDFLTLSEAWEAHKIRNRIAHEPGFELSYRTAAQTIGQYERVFNEFGYL